MKRALDIVLALGLAVPSLLICLPCMIAIWVETRATPVFAQMRVGRDGRLFRIYKLRTMRPDTGDKASHEVASSQITRTGAFLRRVKFDELPQLMNVLLGQMSFVGPRPCLPSQTALIEARANAGIRHLYPGITGPAQLAGVDMSQPQRLAEFDARYSGPWSARRDLAIIARTFLGMGSGDAAGRA